jgi:hypothetical protein
MTHLEARTAKIKRLPMSSVIDGLAGNDNPIYQWDNDCKKKAEPSTLKKSFNFLPLHLISSKNIAKTL